MMLVKGRMFPNAFQARGSGFGASYTNFDRCPPAQVKDIVGSRHRFENIDSNIPIPLTSSAKLPNKCFVPLAEEASFDFSSIVSTSSSPAWWSPSATNMTVPCADLEIVKEAHRTDRWGILSDCWMGELATISHRIALQLPKQDGSGEREWMLPLYHFSKSAVLCWPLEHFEVEGGRDAYFEVCQQVSRPVLRCIHSLSEEMCLATSVRWKSWSFQVHRWPTTTVSSMTPALRLVAEGPVESLIRVACRAAWWSLPRTSLCMYAKMLGVEVAAGSNLFEVLFVLIQSQLGTTDEETLSLCHRRMASKGDEAVTDALLKVDDAAQMLDKHDIDCVRDAQKHQKAEREVKDQFRAAFRSKAEVVRAAAARKKPRRAAPLKKNTLPHHITQSAAKRFLPPSTAVWRDVARGVVVRPLRAAQQVQRSLRAPQQQQRRSLQSVAPAVVVAARREARR